MLVYQGTKSTLQEILTITNPSIGDVWSDGTTGDEYFCKTVNSTTTLGTWEPLGPMIVIGTLDTNNSSSQVVPTTPENLNGTIKLHKISKTGNYADLIDKPTIPAAQVNSDWNATSGITQILNKPSLAAVATSGNYLDLTDVPISVDQQQVVRSKFELPIRAKLTELSIIDDPTIAPSGYAVPCTGVDTYSYNNQYILWTDDSTYQAFNMYIYWPTVNLAPSESYQKSIQIENRSNSTLTINLPSNSTTYDTVYNMYGSTTMTIPSGKIGELIFTFNCIADSPSTWHINVSFNGGVSL